MSCNCILQDYYIADTGEDQIMICVNHEPSRSHLYVSDVNGTKFTLSLEDILYFNPNGSFGATWLRYVMRFYFKKSTDQYVFFPRTFIHFLCLLKITNLLSEIYLLSLHHHMETTPCS